MEHAALQAQFVGLLINRRTRYPEDRRDVLVDGFALRQAADDEDRFVTQIRAARGLRHARRFVAAVRSRGASS